MPVAAVLAIKDDSPYCGCAGLFAPRVPQTLDGPGAIEYRGSPTATPMARRAACRGIGGSLDGDEVECLLSVNQRGRARETTWLLRALNRSGRCRDSEICPCMFVSALSWYQERKGHEYCL